MHYGHKVTLTTGVTQLIVDCVIEDGNPPDTKQTVRCVQRFKEARSSSTVGAVVAHASYLINLASREQPTHARSLRALGDELERCGRLGVDGLVLHPGAHLGRGSQKGVVHIANSLDRVLSRVSSGKTRLLLENTAGQGTYLGSLLAELAEIRQRCNDPAKIGFCLDTCHAFAAGAEIHRRPGLNRWFDEVDDILGLSNVRCFHLNDSQGGCGSHRDRHANIGQGLIGASAFAVLMRSPRLARIPKIIETPAGPDLELHRSDLRRLRAQALRPVRRAALGSACSVW